MNTKYDVEVTITVEAADDDAAFAQVIAELSDKYGAENVYINSVDAVDNDEEAG